MSEVRSLLTGPESKDVYPFIVESGKELTSSRKRSAGLIWAIATKRIVGRQSLVVSCRVITVSRFAPCRKGVMGQGHFTRRGIRVYLDHSCC